MAGLHRHFRRGKHEPNEPHAWGEHVEALVQGIREHDGDEVARCFVVENIMPACMEWGGVLERMTTIGQVDIQLTEDAKKAWRARKYGSAGIKALAINARKLIEAGELDVEKKQKSQSK